ncbi:hypothetical protein KO500_10775 [Cellulophaga baltica]|uniref:hypothetical protein n=1 Tax=Cellulophaga TaxID=104264 RepID=UPI001C065E50|nr:MULTISPECIES: hypothetical protein [Cellulophaga]MBU2996923.1 hypothetical protein [Cellulophaga baltica]MDO6768321.1 hypothetical protein [Cellulophaga sp. 1_MG-2023]
MKINREIKNFELLEQLYQETIDSENVFATLVQSDRHPRHQKYFERRLITQRKFSKAILEEIKTIKYNYAPTTLEDKHHIYNPMLSQLLERNIEGFDVDKLLIEREQLLISYYQKVLSDAKLPEVTRAKLQSQAEDLNSNLQIIELNLGVNKVRDMEHI